METIMNMFKNVNAAIVATDADYKVIYQNEKCKQVFKLAFGTSDYTGTSIHDLHKPETNEKIKLHYQEYQAKTRNQYHYVTNGSRGKITIVNSPFYDDSGEFAGVVEFMFEGTLE